MDEIQRGEIWWADLPEPRRSEPAYRRPVLVVQADSFNRSRIQTVIVAVITGNTELADAPGNVLLPANSTGLPRDSVVERLPASHPRPRFPGRAGRRVAAALATRRRWRSAHCTATLALNQERQPSASQCPTCRLIRPISARYLGGVSLRASERILVSRLERRSRQRRGGPSGRDRRNISMAC